VNASTSLCCELRNETEKSYDQLISFYIAQCVCNNNVLRHVSHRIASGPLNIL
jgi:hypothetical protein